MRGFGANTHRLAEAVRVAVRGATVEEMNLLQEYGIISDNCVTWSDVAECDREQARVWLEENKQ